MEDNCIFCQILAGKTDSDKVSEYNNFIVIKNKYPLTKNHLLIISKSHYKNIINLPGLSGNELLSIIKEQTINLMKSGCVGVKVVQNNGTFPEIDHFHVHLIAVNDGEKLDKSA